MHQLLADVETFTGLLSVLFLCLSVLFTVVRRTRRVAHKICALLSVLMALVHTVLVLRADPTALRSLSDAETAGLTGLAALLLTVVLSAGSAPRRSHAATTCARTRAKRALRVRFPLLFRVVHWITGTCAVAALTAHSLFLQNSTTSRWLFVVLGEGIAVALILRYVLSRLRPAPSPARHQHQHRHLRTENTPVETHETGVVLRTAPVPVRPEKRLVHPRRIAVTQPSEVPSSLAFNPDVLYVAAPDKSELLTHRRELMLCGGKARFFRNLSELRTLLPTGDDRALSSYVLSGDPLFLTDVHEALTHSGVPYDRIRTEPVGSPMLPEDHPSARIARVRSSF